MPKRIANNPIVPPKLSNSKKKLTAPLVANTNFNWRVAYFDATEYRAWDWKLSPKELKELLQFLKLTESNTWAEIRAEKAGRNGHKRYHSMGIETLSKDAQKAIERMFPKDNERPDKIMRFRLNSSARLWGIEENGYFNIMWYDRNHKVYPIKAS